MTIVAMIAKSISGRTTVTLKRSVGTTYVSVPRLHTESSLTPHLIALYHQLRQHNRHSHATLLISTNLMLHRYSAMLHSGQSNTNPTRPQNPPRPYPPSPLPATSSSHH